MSARTILTSGHLYEYISKHNPDILFLFEAKMKLTKFLKKHHNGSSTKQFLQNHGYNHFYEHTSTKKPTKWGYAGVFIFSKHAPTKIQCGFKTQDKDLQEEGRTITAHFQHVIVTGTYSPSAGKPEELKTLQKKLNYFEDLTQHIKTTTDDQATPHILIGDINVARYDNDKYNGALAETNKNYPSTTPQEQKALEKMLNKLHHTDVQKTSKEIHLPYTWFRHQYDKKANRGLRIDHIYCNKNAQKITTRTQSLSEVIGSDHIPIQISITGDNLRKTRRKHEQQPDNTFPINPAETIENAQRHLEASGTLKQKAHQLQQSISEAFPDARPLGQDTLLQAAFINTTEDTDKTRLNSIIEKIVESIQPQTFNNTDEEIGLQHACATETIDISTFKDNSRLPKFRAKVRATNEHIDSQQFANANVLADTGAESCLASLAFMKRLLGSREEVQKQLNTDNLPIFKTAANTFASPIGSIILYLDIKRQKYKHKFYVLEKTPIDLLLGGTFLEKEGAIINYKTKNITFSITNAVEPSHAKSIRTAFTVEEVRKEDILRRTAVLRATQDYKLNSNHEVRLWGQTSMGHSLNDSEAVFGKITRHAECHNCLAANGITYLNKGKTLLKIYNPTEDNITIKKGQILAEFIVAQERNYDTYLVDEERHTHAKTLNQEGTSPLDFLEQGTTKFRDILSQPTEQNKYNQPYTNSEPLPATNSQREKNLSAPNSFPKKQKNPIKRKRPMANEQPTRNCDDTTIKGKFRAGKHSMDSQNRDDITRRTDRETAEQPVAIHSHDDIPVPAIRRRGVHRSNLNFPTSSSVTVRSSERVSQKQPSVVTDRKFVSERGFTVSRRRRSSQEIQKEQETPLQAIPPDMCTPHNSEIFNTPLRQPNLHHHTSAGSQRQRQGSEIAGSKKPQTAGKGDKEKHTNKKPRHGYIQLQPTQISCQAQLSEERDWNDADQVPTKSLPKITWIEARAMSNSQVEEYFEQGPLKYIEIDHPACVLEKAQQWRLKRLLLVNIDVFAINDKDPGTANHPTGAEIKLKPGTEPKCAPLRPTAPPLRPHVQKQIEDMLKYNIIEPSNTPWGANIMLVPKKQPGEWRFVVDLRLCNAATVAMSYPLVRIEDVLTSMAGSTVFSTCDASQGFWQIPMKSEKDKDVTGFRCHMGSFRFKKLPMGLKNASAIFQKFMDGALGKLKWECAVIYIDDCIIYSKTIDEHFKHLELVFQCFRKANIHLKAKKTLLFRNSVPFLGHVISDRGILPDSDKVKAILQANPTTKKEIHSWVSMAGYYRKYIPSFAHKVQPLHDIVNSKTKLPKGGPNQKQKAAIDMVKQWLTTKPILAHPDFSKPFELHTDASTQAIAAVLVQVQEGKERVIQYISRALRPHEKKYHIYELEVLAFIWAMGVTRNYIIHQPFKAVVDNKAMLWLKSKKDSPNRRILRWLLNTQDFDYEIVHRSSKAHANADGLTRCNAMASNVSYGEKMEFCAACENLQPSATETHIICDADAEYGLDTITQQLKKQPKQQQPNLQGSHRTQSCCTLPHAETDTEDDKHEDELYPLPSRMELIKAQKKDEHLAKILKHIENGKAEEIPFELTDGLLVRTTKTPHKFKKKRKYNYQTVSQICVPTSTNNHMRNAFLYSIHGLPIAGHDGIKRSTAKAEKKYWWPNMKKDIKQWCNGCISCQQRKRSRPLRHGLTQNIPTLYAGHTFSFDIVGPLTETRSKGYKYILTCIDNFTRYPWAIPLTNRTMKSVVEALWSIFTQFGFPRLLMSDKEQSFRSQLMKRLMKKMGTAKVETTGWQPQGNAIIERWHRWLNATLSMYCNNKKDNWDEYLDSSLYTYRTTMSTSTGTTPFELMFKRKHRAYSDILYRTSENDLATEKKHHVQTTRSMTDAYKYAWESQQKIITRNNNTRDKNRLDPRFARGDLVMCFDMKFDTEGPKKLQYNHSGPHKILRKSSQSKLHYYIIDVDSKETRKLHVNRLSKYQPHDEHLNPPIGWNSLQKKATNEEQTSNAKIGELVIVEYAPADKTLPPFAVGKLISRADDGTLNIWWIGNNNNNIFAAQRYGYYQQSTNKWYYQDKPIHPSHPRYTSKITESHLKDEDIAIHSFPLGLEQNIPYDILVQLSMNKNIKWTLPKEN